MSAVFEKVSRRRSPEAGAVREAVLGMLRKNKEQLAVIVSWPEMLNARCSLGMTPMFAAAYGLWVEGVHALVRAGADVSEVSVALTLAASDNLPTCQRSEAARMIIVIAFGAARFSAVL